MLSKKRVSEVFSGSLSSVIWVLRLYWKISPRHTFISVFASVAVEIVGIANTYVFAKGIDILLAVSRGESEIVWMYFVVGLVFVVSIVQTGLRLTMNYSHRILSHMFYPKFQELLYKKFIRLGISDLEDPKNNNLMERTRRESSRVERQFYEANTLFGVLASLVTSGFIIFSFAPHLVLVFTITLIPSLILDRKYLSRLWKYDREITEERRRAYDSAYFLQDSRYLLELKITRGYRFLSDHFEKFVKNWTNQLRIIRSNWYRALFGFRIIRSVVEAYADLLVFTRFLNGAISIGNVTFYMRQTSNFMGNLSDLANSINNIYEASLIIGEMQSLFEMEEEKDGTVMMEELKSGPKIEFSGVNFSYPGSKRKVIKNLDLVINPGEKIAIVGKNGAGKTTLIKLLLRFYKADKGTIKINGIDLTELSTNDYYKNVSVLFQEFNTYQNLTVKDNIVMGNIDKAYSEEELLKAARHADVDDFVSEYKEGYDQILSEKYKGGIRPSWGQWQKVAIARFFYRNTPLVIFDEPTAAIDAVSEAKIFNKIYSFFKDKTVIIISHRFSTVRNADRIVVFGKGEMLEQGTHKELMKKGGAYAKAFNLQAEGYKT